MSNSNDLSELFGSQLEQAVPRTQMRREFQDGVYRVRGMSMKKDVYKSGKWVGRAYARFVFEFQDGPVRRQVSQMLPWLPGKPFFEKNFELICGMTLAQFVEHCRSERFTPDQQSKFFQSRFKGVEYEAEIKRQGDWLNVWRLHKRFGPAEPGTPLPSVDDAAAAPDPAAPAASAEQPDGASQPDAAPDVPAAADDPAAPQWDPEPFAAQPQATDPATRSLLGEVRRMAQELGLDEEGLQALSDEEFAVPLERLDRGSQQALIQLLEEKRSLGERFD